ncbi:ankyrin repeat domain-containing protein 50-like [Ostrinia nubilalis]|uniref:ankyrin repeat domain-containing protein 50-like n=1 Tax=Ostrinia nubilalis TaxID=29057 RepID=UPI0030825599
MSSQTELNRSGTVLDGVADGFIALREIREIPGTLNGLYLWLAQRLFHGRRFTKVRLLLDVLLAARCGVTEEMLYRCLLTKEYSVSREDFTRRLHLLRRILVMEKSTGYLSLFHHSFAAWLGDVKHCTRRYLCCPADGHAALAMHYTLTARRLTALEIHNYVYHMTNLEQHMAAQKKSKTTDTEEVLDLHTLMLLWVLDSGCDVESALKRENDALRYMDSLANKTINEGNLDEKTGEPDSEGRESISADTSALEAIMPELVGGDASGRWPRDRTVFRTLLELSRTDGGHDADTEIHDLLTTEPETEVKTEASTEEPEEPVILDPNLVFELATKGDDEALAALVKRYPQLVEVTDASGGTALHCAARGGRAKAALVLLSAGARADAADADGWSALRAAAWAGHTEVVEVLLEFGCDVDCVDADNRTALRAAAWSGHEAVVSRLLAAGADPDKADAEGRTPLIAAAYMGHADIVRALLDAGANVDHADEDGRTALSVASLCASGGACASLLLERGADVSAADRDQAAPLLVAAFEGHTEICELLLEAEADIEAADAPGRTALWAAASAGHARTVRLLLFWGACVDTMDAEGRTVLSAAAAQATGDVNEICELLLEAEADIEAADAPGRTALWAAASAGHARTVRLLLFWGACVDTMDAEGRTVLSAAAAQGG